MNTMANMLCLRERINAHFQRVRRRLGRTFDIFEYLVDNSPLWLIAASGLLLGTIETFTSPFLGIKYLTSDNLLVTGMVFMSFFGIPLITKMYKVSKKFT
jgi:hypothetical protein